MQSLVAVTLCLLAAGTSPSPTKESRRPWDTISKRMHGGQAVDISQFPWLVAVLFDDEHNCGGSIISHRWVMTAAHCIPSGSVERYKVRAGSSNWDEGGTLYTCNDLIIHSSYSSTTTDYDMGLIEINGTIQMDDNVKIVSLATSEPVAGTSMNVSGWGDTSLGSGSSLTLYAAAVEILERSSCNSTLLGNVTDNMICTVVDETGKGPCKGDSGGALVADGTQYGVVSWRWAECGSPAIPTVYASVAALRSWIEEKMGV